MTEEIAVIKTSIKGKKAVNQDAVRVYSDGPVSVFCVADGLGSAIESGYGSHMACRAVVDCVKRARKYNISLSSKSIVERWLSLVSKRGFSPRNCMTTCSFVIVNQQNCKVTIGIIGDSAVYAALDGVMVSERESKDFLNETEALGDGCLRQFVTSSFNYTDSFQILLASDGICDELDNDSIPSLLDYLRDSYNSVHKQLRNRRFYNEIRSTIGNKNYDDKSIIFAWKG